MPEPSPRDQAGAKSGVLRIDIDAVREAAGEKVFERGADYHADGLVEIIAFEGGRVVARVFGSETYRAELTVLNGEVLGRCSCPAFSDWGFCKHLVATALAVRDATPGDIARASDRGARTRDHLRARGVEALVGMIMDLAERDPALLRRGSGATRRRAGSSGVCGSSGSAWTRMRSTPRTSRISHAVTRPSATSSSCCARNLAADQQPIGKRLLSGYEGVTRRSVEDRHGGG